MATLSIRSDLRDEPVLYRIGGPGGKIRFCVGERDGLRSSIWVIESPRNKKDIYVGQRDIMGFQKVSLHESGAWHFAWSREHAPLVLAEGQSRFIDEWPRPPEAGGGWTWALRIWISAEDLAPLGPPQGNRKSVRAIKWLPAPEPGVTYGFHLAIARTEQGEVELKGYSPLDGFWLSQDDDDRNRNEMEVCLLLLSRLTRSPENQQWIDETRGRLITIAEDQRVDLNSPTLRGYFYGSDESGVRSLWDLSLGRPKGATATE